MPMMLIKGSIYFIAMCMLGYAGAMVIRSKSFEEWALSSIILGLFSITISLITIRENF